MRMSFFRGSSFALPEHTSKQVKLVFTGIPGCGKGDLVAFLRNYESQEPDAEGEQAFSFMDMSDSLDRPSAYNSIEFNYHKLSFSAFDFDIDSLQNSRLKLLARGSNTVIVFVVNLPQFIGQQADMSMRTSLNVLHRLRALKVLGSRRKTKDGMYHSACVLMFLGTQEFRENLLRVPFKLTTAQTVGKDLVPYNEDYIGPELMLCDTDCCGLNGRDYSANGNDEEFERAYEAAVGYIMQKHRSALRTHAKSREFSHVIDSKATPKEVMKLIYKDTKEFILFRYLEHGGFLDKASE